MDYEIILGDVAYNPRTKGKIKSFLIKLIGEDNFNVLGNGNSFTGFSLWDLTEENIEKIKSYFATEKFPGKISFEQF